MPYFNSISARLTIGNIRMFILRLIAKSAAKMLETNKKNGITLKFQRVVLIAGGGILTALATSSAQAVSVGAGFTPNIAQWTSTVNPLVGNSSTAMYVFEMYERGYNFKIGILPDTAGVSILCTVADSSAGAWSSLDGYSGWLLAPGVLLVPNGSVSGHTAFTGGATWKGDFSGSWSAKGIPSGSTQSSTTANCSGPKPTGFNNSDRAWMAEGNTSTLTLTLGVYVSQTAKEVSIPVRYMYHLKAGYNDMPAGDVQMNARAIKRFALPAIEVISTSCTIDTPAEVKFGDVSSGKSAQENSIAVPSSLSFSCSKLSNKNEAISYSVKPKTEAGGQYTFPIISTGGGTAGDIRGFRGATASADAGCANKSSSVRMDNTPSVLRTITQSSSWSEEFIWVLCPRAQAKPGPASATATIDVSW